mmetsp:Transcript_63485/g.200792  ORF Transcript_63485/g.200792 Transcript_63485/m.200792 type:complete len:91 (+) Transcript_63485:261-533(+)
MKHIHKVSMVAATVLGAWVGVLAADLTREQRFYAQLAPVIAILVFGVYSAATIVYNVATFPCCPEQGELLQKDIAEAKAYLKKHNITDRK